jgi:hypothetical protein
MTGWNQIRQIRKLEERADMLGMKFAPYRHNDYNEDNVSLIPKDQNTLPIYTRDAELFAGSLEGADHWMQGVLWAREYDRMTVDKKLDDKRVRKEQDLRNQQLMETIKNSDVKNEVV